MASEERKVDENLYSRQIGVYGMEVMGKLIRMDVLIVGMRGVGMEAAKNLVLAGPRSVTIFDPEPAAIADLGANFYLTEADIGKPRAEAVVDKLAALNGGVAVSVLGEGVLSEAVLDRFHAVVFTNTPRSQLVRYNEYCHAHSPPIAFMAVDVYGAAAYGFSDFGPAHTINDLDGEQGKTHIVTHVTQNNPGIVTTHDDKLLSFNDGDYVRFSEVEGMTELNTAKLHKIKGVNQRHHSFEIGDTSAFGEHSGGGLVTPVKVPVTVRYGTMRQAIVEPTGQRNFAMVTPVDGGAPDQVRSGFAAVTAFVEKNGGELPDLSNPEHVEAIVGSAAGTKSGAGADTEALRTILSEAEVKTVSALTGSFGMITPDYGKFGRPEQLHVAFEAVSAFFDKHGALPELHNEAHAEECVTLATDFNEAQKAAKEAGEGKEAAEGGAPAEPNALVLDEVDADVVRKVASLARAEMQPLCAVFGGIIAQEVVKVTGKYSPLGGFLYLDAFEALPTEALPAAETEPAGSRYDHSIALFGRAFVAKLAAQKVFLVGAGALGCEFLKAFALMGVSCGPEGMTTVTDMDTIEISNLNRQFLFHRKDVEQPKSKVAALAAQEMNPEFNVRHSLTRVGTDTEETWDDAFWEGLDFVTNALDNVKARLYVDSRCVFYLKPLLESGTLGTKANTQVIAPHKTESYGDSVDPPEESIAMCTLRNFPNQIEHCIEWARDMFAGTFTSGAQDAVEFIKGPAAMIESLESETNFASKRARLEGILNAITTSRGATFDQCVMIARKIFNDHFYLSICQLLHNFPADHADPKTGAKFWSGPKRAPTPNVFDAADPLHFDFVCSAAILAANTFGVAIPAGATTHEVMDPLLARVTVPEFVPKKVAIKSGEEDKTVEGSEDDMVVCDSLVKELMAFDAPALAKLTVVPQEFEKDDDANFHVAFIAGAANLRARNYKIKEASHHEVKMIAGKIIPAIATTTAMATGLVCLELYKTVADRELEARRNSFVNLAMNVYSMAEPMPPKKNVSKDFDVMVGGPVRALPEGFTPWDKQVIRKGDITCGQLVEHFMSEFKLEVPMVSCGEKMLYAPMIYAKHRPRETMTISAVYEQVFGAPPPRDYIMLDLSCEDDDGDVIVPVVQLYWK